jgi:anti-anti-sigma regulatory factor
MATKQKKKPENKKPKKHKKTAKVQLDAATVHQFESQLREGLVSSAAVMSTDNSALKRKGDAKVELDAATAARVSEVLRKGLVASQVVMATEVPQLDKMTGKVKGKSKRRPAKKS